MNDSERHGHLVVLMGQPTGDELLDSPSVRIMNAAFLPDCLDVTMSNDATQENFEKLIH